MSSPSFPVSLDALANPGPTTETDDTGFELDIVVSRLQNVAMAIEQKLGIGASTPPATAAVLRRTATGSSAWGQLATADLGVGLVGQMFTVSIAGLSAGTFALTPMTGSTISGVQTSGKLLFGVALVGYGSTALLSGAQVVVYEGSTAIAALGNEYQAAGLYVGKTLMSVFTPSAGAHTYFLQWSNPSAGTIAFNAATFFALELK
jgi:hypothetical protein